MLAGISATPTVTRRRRSNSPRNPASVTSLAPTTCALRRTTAVHVQLICGALPRAKLVPKLKEEGVTHVVNMVAEYGGPVTEYRAAGITQGS